MKRISYLLITALLASFLSGCGSSDNTSTESSVQEESVDKSSIGTVISTVLATELFSDENAVNIDLSSQQDTLSITAPGTYALSGVFEGQVIVNVADEGKVKIILNGAEITNNNSACIYVENADKVIISSNKDSINILSSTGVFDESEDNKIDATIFSRDDLNLNGEGTIIVNSSYGHAIVCKDKLKIKDGTITVTAYKKGICGKDSIEIEDGKIDIVSGTNCLDSEGDIEISGGQINMSSDRKDGIHTDGNVAITDGVIVVGKSEEGIEGLTVTISGGSVDITSNDDGINSSGSNSTESNWQIGSNPFLADDGADITVSGGKLVVNANGDGIDSNDTLNISGGEIYVSGSESGGDSAIDYSTDAVITGGKVIALGNASMAEGFGLNSTQGNILYNINTTYQAGTNVSLKDCDGNVLITYSAPKSFSSVVVSCEEMTENGTYYLIIDNEEIEITLEGLSYSNSNGGFGFGNGMNSNGQYPGGKPDGNMRPNDFSPPEGFNQFSGGDNSQIPPLT